MKAAFLKQTGNPQVIQYGDLPDPKPGPKEVLVRVEAAALNPIDTYIRSGVIPMQLPQPYIPGCDLAGTVEEVGSGATRFKKGDRVWGSNQGLFGRQGSFAELAAVSEEWLYPTPDQQSSEEAAAGALVGITAQLGLFANARLVSGEMLYVNGGSGGVGSAVVQFAKAEGGKVITTAGSEEKRDLCKRLGADHVLDYHARNIDEQIRNACRDQGGIDIWWETLREPDVERTIGFMKKRGRIIVMAGREARIEFTLGPFYVNDLKLMGFAMFNATPLEQQVAAERMNRWTVEGKWKPVIGARFPFSEAAQAHQLQEENTLGGASTLTGKIVLTP